MICEVVDMQHAAALRLSLLISLGLVEAACGGTTDGGGHGGSGGGSGNENQAGRVTVGGETTGGSGVTVGGNGGDGGTTAGAGAGSPLGHPVTQCSSPKLDPSTGLVTCAEGYTHRPKAVGCKVLDEGAGGYTGADAPAPVRANGTLACGSDPTLCDQFEYGFCRGGGLSFPTCQSGCVTDADCGVGRICLCDTPESPTGGACRDAACQVDADCGDKSRCASYPQPCGNDGYACLNDADACTSNADCKAGGTCSWDAENHRRCLNVACGRPFLVQDEARTAPVTADAAWSSSPGLLPRVEHLTNRERAALAEHWTRMGQMEHASIAAFARFQLQLLALGAPPELVEACTRALADETAHTRLCFELASAYAGRALGPGPLDVTGSLAVSALDEVVDLVLREGCFGETGAALEAREAAESAADPVIAAAYTQIAADEQRHAELAFRFVRWALGRSDLAVAARIARVLTAPPASSEACRAVTLPCLRALLVSTNTRRALC